MGVINGNDGRGVNYAFLYCILFSRWNGLDFGVSRQPHGQFKGGSGKIPSSQ